MKANRKVRKGETKESGPAFQSQAREKRPEESHSEDLCYYDKTWRRKFNQQAQPRKCRSFSHRMLFQLIGGNRQQRDLRNLTKNNDGRKSFFFHSKAT